MTCLSAPQPVTLEGHIEKVSFHNRENQFTIARFQVTGTDNLVTVLGLLPHPHPGSVLRITGTWETHARYGQQLRIVTAETVLPSSIDGIRQYLASGFVKGVGPRTIARLVNHFQGETLAVIENAPDRLSEVKGIGRQTARRISAVWRTEHAFRGLVRFLQENGVNTLYAGRIFAAYGADSISVIQNEPLRLSHDFPRIGFTIADAVMQNCGVPLDDPRRVESCVLHLLGESLNDGNTFVPATDLAERCRVVFKIDEEPVATACRNLEEANEVVIEDRSVDPPQQAVYLAALHHGENTIATRIKALLSFPVRPPEMDRDRIAAQVLARLAIALSSEQTAVIANIFAFRVAIVTGGPGTGKTTLIRSITAVFESLGKKIVLAAPTGRAARRLAQVSGRKAHTIHRLLGYNPVEDGFEHNADNPLQADVVIIDEASMVDTLLMAQLLQAIHVSSRLILVGDAFQLPSVGAGNVLADLIRSQAIRTFELNEIFRQDRESAIILNAHRVRRGAQPVIAPSDFSGQITDFYFFDEKRPEAVLETIVDLCRRGVPKHFALDPINDIQVLTPMHKGVVGTINLNRVLQERLNPHPEGLRIGGRSFKPGDKVMHLKNNYLKDVFNGDSGILSNIDLKKEIAAVDYDGRIVEYEFTELEEIGPAYAVTVHKSQGAEYPAVIMPLVTQHFVMLQRNLLYTAITRGKQLVVLIGTRKALDIALRNDRPRQRLSGLTDRLFIDRIDCLY
jgi:exodeoxyribonuclease V alpha subunit